MKTHDTTKVRDWQPYWESFALNADPLAAIDGWEVSRVHYWRKTGELVKLLAPSIEDRVVNIGCGIGLLEIAAAKMAGEWIALDFSWNMVRRTREGRHDYSRLHVIQGNALALPLADTCVDKAVCHGVTEYLSLDEVGQLMCEMARVVRPGGNIIIGDIAERRSHLGFWQGIKAVYTREGLRGLGLRLLLRLSWPIRQLVIAAKRRYLLATHRLRALEKPTAISSFTREELMGLARRHGLHARCIDKGSGAFYRGRFTLVLVAEISRQPALNTGRWI
jgi:ubiquinone/menaquinone biosynthesis C-methylase UbiE